MDTSSIVSQLYRPYSPWKSSRAWFGQERQSRRNPTVILMSFGAPVI